MSSEHTIYARPVNDSDEVREEYEMDESLTLIERTINEEPAKASSAAGGVGRHTLGLILLLCVVFLWTASSFLGSSIFADDTYAKPFFLTYLNTAAFIFCLIPGLWRSAQEQQKQGLLKQNFRAALAGFDLRALWTQTNTKDLLQRGEEEEAFVKNTTEDVKILGRSETLPLIPTARMALNFCLLWFSANYFAMACLQYTTVASTTILTSTSSMWTLLIGAVARVEKFTWRKLSGVLLSLAGVAVISQVDLSAKDTTGDGDGSSFPNKPPLELALGDGFALLSAVIYGVYTITLKHTTICAMPRHLHMPTFFGFVGLFNVLFLWPAFLILHYTGLEKFQPPPSGQVWTILVVNSVSSLLSDICWAYAMVFTSPLVVTVGLSLTIPLSLVGEMIIQGRFESWVYWLGAFIVVGSFVFVERAGRDDEESVTVELDEENMGEPGPAIVVEDCEDQARSRSDLETSLLMSHENRNTSIYRQSPEVP